VVLLALVVECLLNAHFEGGLHKLVCLVVLVLICDNRMNLVVVQSQNFVVY
jgi:hypothetical protein